MSERWFILALALMGCITVGFVADKCTKANVEIAKERANTSRQIDLGLGKRRDQ